MSEEKEHVLFQSTHGIQSLYCIKMCLYCTTEALLYTVTLFPTLTTPVRQYFRKLTTGTEQLRAQSIVHQHDANNLRSIIKKRTTRTKGKRVVLKGHFHVSTQALCDAVVEAEKSRKRRAGKKVKTKGKAISYNAESEEDIEEEAEDQSESEIGDCIIVDVEPFIC
jgi:hypothetical protein